MRIAVLGTRGFPDIQGGVEVHCQNLYPRIAEKSGFEILVFTRKPYMKTNIKEYKGVKLIPLPAIKSKNLETILHTFVGLLAAVKYKPNIVHFHGIGPSFFIPLAKLFGFKTVMTYHSANYRHLKWGRLAKLFLRISEFLGVTYADLVIAVSRSITNEISKKYKKEIIFIPNGVASPEIIHDDLFLQLYGLEREKYLLAIGRIVPEKGFSDLIAAFYNSNLSKSNWKLVIVGEADHKSSYSAEIEEKASRLKNIILTGFLSGRPLQALYSNAGLFIIPSYYEGLPIALLEAMSYGLSCIASDISANRELGLEEERYFKPGDIPMLTKKIDAFSSNPIKVAGKTAKMASIVEMYNWDSIALKTIEAYKALWG